MRENIKNSVYRIVHKAFDFGQGITVTYVEDNVEVNSFQCMEWTDIQRAAEGLGIGVAGTTDGEQRIWLFETQELINKGMGRFRPDAYFRHNDERWDLVKGSPLSVNVGPQGATNPITYIHVRRAIELDSTVRGDGFGFNLEADET